MSTEAIIGRVLSLEIREPRVGWYEHSRYVVRGYASDYIYFDSYYTPGSRTAILKDSDGSFHSTARFHPKQFARLKRDLAAQGGAQEQTADGT